MAISWQDILEELSTNYSETYEGDEDLDLPTPEAFDEQLEQMTPDELVEEYNRVYPEADLSVEDIKE